MEITDIVADALSHARAKAEIRKAQIIQSNDLTRAEREVLVATGWLQEIIRGWYMLVRPDVATGDTAAWYANFWDFVRIYLNARFGDHYCLSAESSLDSHIENPSIPKQVVVVVQEGGGLRQLMYNTSLMTYADPKNFPEEVVQKQGLQVMSLPYALAKVSPTYFQSNPREAELALRSIKTSDELTRVIVRYRFKAAAARFIGAYQFLHDDEMAENIKNDLVPFGLLVHASNPFQKNTAPLLKSTRLKSPYAGRIQAMWVEARSTIIRNFPKALGLPKDQAAYLHHMDEIYQYDAYHSLSIEGYQVSPALIERVKNKKWNPTANVYDHNIKNAMAAKGYFDAFQQVKKSIAQIIGGESAAKVVKKDLMLWYRHLFGPSVQAGILPQEALLGYRNDPVFIRNSIHVPPRKEAVLDAMDSFFQCLAHESHPGVCALLGHYFFVFIHPYMDGNGRMARFLMNAFLASGGYPWTIVRVDNRKSYISILEKTHTYFDMTDFCRFIKEEMQNGEGIPFARA